MQPKESKTNRHFNLSLAKSCIRILAGAALSKGFLLSAGVLLVIAELLGIAEEF